jgi:hypothetical protein
MERKVEDRRLQKGTDIEGKEGYVEVATWAATRKRNRQAAVGEEGGARPEPASLHGTSMYKWFMKYI